MHRARIAALIAAATIIAIGAVACGDDDDDDGDGGDATPAVTQPAAAPTTAATEAVPTTAATPDTGGDEGTEDQTVVAENFTFSPSTLTAALGEPLTVVLQNADSVPHTLTVYEADDFQAPVSGADTGNVSGGSTGEFVATFPEAKTYAFRCEVHPNMQGSITVQ